VRSVVCNEDRSGFADDREVAAAGHTVQVALDFSRKSRGHPFKMEAFHDNDTELKIGSATIGAVVEYL
jgi:hypothetical protein